MPCTVSAPHPMRVCHHSATRLLHCLPFYGVAMLKRPHICWPMPESGLHCPLPPLRPSWTDLTPASVGVSCSAGRSRSFKVYLFKVWHADALYEIELSCLAGVDEASPEHAKNFASTLSITETHRAPSQMPLRTSGIFGCQCYNAIGCSAALDMLLRGRHRPIRRSLAVSLRLPHSGCLLGTPRAAQKVCRRPCASNPAHSCPFLLYLTRVWPLVLRVFRCTRARVGGRSRCWRVCVPCQHAWGA